MKFIIFVMAMLLCILLVVGYALLVMAHDSDEKANKMYIEWKENANERNNSKDDQRSCKS